MKKLSLLAIVMIAFVGAVNAQVDVMFGAKGGLNLSSFTNQESLNDISSVNDVIKFGENNKTRVGFHAGVTGDVKIGNYIGLGAELLYSTQGTKESYEGPLTGTEYSNTFKLDYINLPILLKGYVFDGINVYTGVQPGFVVNAKNVTKAGDEEVTIDLKKESNDNTFALVNDFDLSIPVGIGYRSDDYGIAFDARYNIGATSIFEKDDNNDIKAPKNSVFQVGVGFAF